MTAPVRHSRSSHTSSSDEQFTITLPTTNPGDVVEIWWAGDGVNTGMEDVCGDFVGWNRDHIANSGTAMCYGRLFKVDLDGSLSGQTLTMSSPNEKWCIEAGAISGMHVDSVTSGGSVPATGSSTAPNPPNNAGYNPDGTFGTLFEAVAFSDGSGSFSAVPSGYTSVARLNNAAADGVALDLATRADDTHDHGVDEDPSAFTKSTTSAWAAFTQYYISSITPPGTSAFIQWEKAETLSGDVLDFTVEVTSEFFCCALHNAQLAQIVSLTLDPGGPNERIPVIVNVGGTDAAIDSGGSGTTAWYRLDPDNMPAPGTYTLRVTLNTIRNCALFSFGVADGHEVAAVLNVAHASSASGTVDTLTGDLVLMAASQIANAPGGVPKQGPPWVTRTIDAVVMWPRLSAWFGTQEYVTVFGRRNRADATRTITVSATTVNLSAIVIRYRPRPPQNAPYFGGFA